MFSPVHSVFCSYSLSDWICSVSSLWIVVTMYRQIQVDISHILGNLITVIFDYQILRKPLKILSL